MQHTEKYQFNLIEGSDSFLPEPLNDNARKTEAALAALPRVHFQTWTGAGSNSKLLEFPFKPQVVLVASATFDSYSPCVITYGQEGATRINTTEIKELRLNWGETRVSLSLAYGTASPLYVFDLKDRPYFALAIG